MIAESSSPIRSTISMTNMSRKRQWILTLVLLIGTIAVFTGGYLWRKHRNKDKVYVELRPIHTKLGWGYEIWTGKSRYIYQDIIPAISGQYGFRTREDAMAVGKLVYDRLIGGKLPIIEPAEIRAMGLMPDTTGKTPDSAQRVRDLEKAIQPDTLHKK